MRRRKAYRSSARRSAWGTWFVDSGNGIAAPAANIVDNDQVLALADYTLSSGKREKVRVKRILFQVMFTQVEGATLNTGASCVFDACLVAMTPDVAAASLVAGNSYAQLYDQDCRVLRAGSRSWTDASPHGASPTGIFAQQRCPTFTWNVKCNLLLTEPQGLYFWQKRIDVDSSPNVSFEYTYRSRVYFTRGVR